LDEGWHLWATISLASSLISAIIISRIEMYDGQRNLKFAPTSSPFTFLFSDCIEIHCCYGNVVYTCLPRDAVLCAISLCLSVCPSVTSRCCIETAGQIELAFGMEASFPLSHAVIRKYMYQKINYFPLELCPSCGRRKFLYGKSIVSHEQLPCVFAPRLTNADGFISN